MFTPKSASTASDLKNKVQRSIVDGGMNLSLDICPNYKLPPIDNVIKMS